MTVTPDVQDRGELLLEQLGLPPYQARVLLALLASAGPATSLDLAGLSGVPRTSIYLTVEALIGKGLAAPCTLPGPGGARRWVASSWDAVGSTLRMNARADHEDRLRRIERFEVLAAGGRRPA